MIVEVFDSFVSRSSTITAVSSVAELNIALEEPFAERSTADTSAVSVNRELEWMLTLPKFPATGTLCSMSCVRMRMRIEEIA